MHRNFPLLKEMLKQEIVAIVVVGRIGRCLVSVASIDIDIRVVGVPTSIGYGFGANGLAGLASMLQSALLAWQ